MSDVQTSILSISGSDITGRSGIQADIKTISALGANGLSVVSCITVQDDKGIREIEDLPAALVLSQVRAALSDCCPRATKIGLVRRADVIRALRNEVLGCRNLVLAPGFSAADGTVMTDVAGIDAFMRYLIPEARLLMLRRRDAEKMLGMKIQTDEDMKRAAAALLGIGAQWVLLRGNQHAEGMLTTLLMGEGHCSFFTTHNTEGWQRHGVAGALSAAITTRLGMGDDVPTAIRNAHDYMHAQVVYAQERADRQLRPVDIYNRYISLVAEYYGQAHDVAFYADRLCITARYLSQVTDKVAGKPPKQIIADYLMSEARSYLSHSRLTMQEIADRLGFSSGAMFCKFFKGQAGKSPSEER